MTGELILIVDDAPENRDFMVEYVLTPSGYRSITANNGKEGLEKAIKYQPDLIVLDYSMPVLDGPGMIKAMHREGLDIPIILMTFHGSEDVVLEVFRLGVRDFINKPFYPEEMERAIDRHLAEVRLRREKDALTERVLQANMELKARLQELNMLYHVGKQVTSLIEMAALLLQIVESAVKITRSETGYIYILEGKQLVCKASKDRGGAPARSMEQATNDPIAGHVIKSGKPLVLDSNQTRKLRGRGIIAAYTPLVIGGEVIGVLGVERSVMQAEDMFTSHDSALLSALSDYVAIAISNSRNYEASRNRGGVRPVAPADASQSRQINAGTGEISVIALEVHGVQSMVDTTTPQQIIAMLNEYTAMAAQHIVAYGGRIININGTRLIGVLNAPDPLADHVHRVAQVALDLIRALQQTDAGNGQISYRVGVNTGIATVGTLDIDDVTTFTAIGETVSLCERLLDYAAPGQILAGEALINRLGQAVESRPMGEIRVKGRKQPAMVYEIIRLAN